ncbi:MAG: (2Fe-2S)-binding protein [Burkholderiaceae bacterium]|nr:(2Fe-2S)-binding protein [Burkholderiaceae bacterium]
MKQVVSLDINGEIHELAVHGDATLLSVLRESLGLCGTKRGCDSGGCGSCTVHVDGQAVYSCMTYAVSAQGRKIVTIEGLSTDGRLDQVQQAFIEKGAVQCGYCTCGMIMTTKQLLRDHPHPDDDTIRHGIAGNLCRCTGYHKIVEAIKTAANA